MQKYVVATANRPLGLTKFDVKLLKVVTWFESTVARPNVYIISFKTVGKKVTKWSVNPVTENF